MGARRPGTQSSDDASRDALPAPQPFFAHSELIPSVLEAAGFACWSWDIGSKEVTWSANLESVLGKPHGSLAGTTSVFESDVHPDDRPAVLATMQEVVQTLTPRRIMYRLQPRPGGAQRWIETLAMAQVESGRAVRLVGLCRDVTDRAKTHNELRQRAIQQEAVARLGERALTENDLQKFCDGAVATVAQVLDSELVKILELIPGDAELLLRSGVGWKPELIGTAHVSTARDTHAGFTLASGRPIILENLANEKRFAGSPLLHNNGVVSGIAVPIAGRDGRAYGVLTAHCRTLRKFSEHDVSFITAVASVVAGAIARLQSDRRQELMIRELRHRSGNLFAQLLAMFSQTAKTSKNIPELATKYQARVLALASAHRLITEGGWKSASLAELLNTLLGPYLDRISLSGSSVFLEPDVTFGLSTAVHELATNALQHGSLSGRNGRVEVTWFASRTALGPTLTIDWKERQGPRPRRAPRARLGSKLINLSIERQLNGKVEQNFSPEGLDVKLIVPITHERWPGIAASATASDASRTVK
ncbi:MAG TPA: HWE histidine kinase domain-containing protein [Xanthobacteraceae bacterium]|jgi:PAS domain S-box-containing protein